MLGAAARTIEEVRLRLPTAASWRKEPVDKEYDVVVIGSGPAGLQAAIHAARRKRRVLVLGRADRSNCAKGHIENLFGVAGAKGAELVETGREQADRSGAELRDEDATRLGKDGDLFIVKPETGGEVRAKAVVLAMGVTVNKLGGRGQGVPGEKELVGRGVSYCVDCDGPLFRNKCVVVTGDGSAAAEGAMALLAWASEVHLVSPRLDVAEEMREEVASSKVIRHIPEKIAKILGSEDAESVTGVELESGGGIEAEGVFIELGGKGALSLTADLAVELDPETFKHIVTDNRQRTNVEGLFAAGDVTGPPWQVAKAVGEGCVAGLEAAAYAKKIGSAGGA
jgi:thioredoxin reductase (NADPH)